MESRLEMDLATHVAHAFAERYRALCRAVLAPRKARPAKPGAGRDGSYFVALPQLDHAAAHPVDPYLVRRLAGRDHETLVCLFYDEHGAFRGEQAEEGLASAVIAGRCALSHAAVAHEARYVVIAHNHPAGEARPSAQDIEATRAIHRLFAALGASLVDHAIVAYDGSAFSFLQAGLI